MANPIGELIDDYKLEGMARYAGKPKSQEDRAREAMNAKNSGDARKYVQEVKEAYGKGASTLCMIYNGTGETLYYVDDHDWLGCLGRTPYPPEIGNGQWASFLHVHPEHIPAGSEATVIYRGKQKYGCNRDFTIAWSTPFAAWHKNKAYCEMNDVDNSSSWDAIYKHLGNSSREHKVDTDDMFFKVATASGSSPVFTATLTIPPFRD